MRRLFLFVPVQRGNSGAGAISSSLSRGRRGRRARGRAGGRFGFAFLVGGGDGGREHVERDPLLLLRLGVLGPAERRPAAGAIIVAVAVGALGPLGARLALGTLLALRACLALVAGLALAARFALVARLAVRGLAGFVAVAGITLVRLAPPSPSSPS